MRVFNADEMRAVDQRAILELGIPSMVLMENAAIGLVDALGERFPQARRVAIVCGPGNNGGDGLALARHLDGRGYDLDIFVLTRGTRPQGDAGQQLAILERIPLAVGLLAPGDDLAGLFAACGVADLIVDALFGTGLTRALEGHYAAAIEGLARAGKPILAVDLPSGLDASRAVPIGPCAAATVSVTFAAPKIAHCLEPAAALCGEVVVADLGIPRELIEQAPGTWHLGDRDEIAALLPYRPKDGHKGSFGHALVVGGSPGKSGAVALATRAALRSGAGLVTAVVPSALLPILEVLSLESMTLGLPVFGPRPAPPEGPASTDPAWGREAWALLAAFAADKDAVALGPGLGRGPGATELVRGAVTGLEMPLVLDADGLNALEGDLSWVRARRAATILTPHPGEMARLLKWADAAAVQRDRPAAVRQAAELSGAVVVLKGAQTLIATPEGELWINPTGSSTLATGGTGDVLTGIVVALLAQGLEALAAAQVAVFAHGLAGEQLATRRGPFGVVALEVAEVLPAIWQELSGSSADPEIRDAP